MTDDQIHPASQEPFRASQGEPGNPQRMPLPSWPTASSRLNISGKETQPHLPATLTASRSGMLPASAAGAPARPTNRPATVTRARGSQARKSGKHRWKRRLLIAALAILVLGSIVGFGGYFGLYSSARQLATDGVQHLQNAETALKQLPADPLNAETITNARNEFSAAQNDFDGVNIRLNLAGPFLGPAGLIFGNGDELQSYVHLARMAFDLSKAGNETLSAALTLLGKEQNAFHSPQPSQGLSMADIASLQQTASDAISLLDDASNQLPGVVVSALPRDLSIQAAINLFHSNYPGLRGTLLSLQSIFAAAPKLFGIGQSTTYLAELLDTDEQRPTGGFITSIGQMTFQNGQLGSLSLQDTYLLDTPYQASHTTPIPADDSWFTLDKNWGLRDANLEPDFPAAAKAAEQLYTAEGGKPVDGVIALTSTFFTHLLSNTGPIQIPELNITVSADNFIDQLHHYQFQRSHGDQVSQKQIAANNKQFPALFSKYLLAALRQASPEAALAIVEQAALGVGGKDLQLYSNDAQAENHLAQVNLAGAVEAPTGDALFIVDTNLSGNKADAYISKAIQDNIILDDQGDAIHHLFITYHWSDQGPTYGSSAYTDYLRIYVPPTSQIQGYSGFTNIDASTAYRRTVWSSTLHLVYKQQIRLTVTYSVPNVVQQQNGQTHYSFLVQRQPNFPFSMLALSINLPQTTSVIQHSNNLTNLQFPAQNLDRDTTISVDYT